MSSLELAANQLESARKYSLGLIESFEPGDWFRQPHEGVTHLAWQAAHLALAQYSLVLRRTRGELADDETLIPTAFREKYGKGTSPNPDPAANFSQVEIREVMDRVHAKSIDYLSKLSDADSNRPMREPHPHFSDWLGAFLWCGQHEYMHAGQIGLLRRLLGKPPRW